MKILIIDDDIFVLSLTTEVLRNLGYIDVDSANNGVEALSRLDNSPQAYDIIICDLNMPEMDGIEFMRHAAAKQYGGRLILLSGEDRRILEMARELATVQSLNILGYITKPVTLDSFRALLGEYTPHGNQNAVDTSQEPVTKQELVAGLRDENGPLFLFYQPVVHIRSGDITGVETIPKWQHPTRGLLEAHTFLPVAEQNGLANQLFMTIFDKATQQLSEWLNDGIFLQNYISLSSETLADPDNVQHILERPGQLGIQHKNIVVQFPECHIAQNISDVFETLARFHFKKIGIAIDNFGKCKLTKDQINSFPFALLKLNRDFLRSADEGNEIVSLIKKGTDFGRYLRTEVALTDVNEKQDWELAESMGFNFAQGSFCSEALSSESLIEFLETWNPPPRLPRQLASQPTATTFGP